MSAGSWMIRAIDLKAGEPLPTAGFRVLAWRQHREHLAAALSLTNWLLLEGAASAGEDLDALLSEARERRIFLGMNEEMRTICKRHLRAVGDAMSALVPLIGPAQPLRVRMARRLAFWRWRREREATTVARGRAAELLAHLEPPPDERATAFREYLQRPAEGEV